MGWYILDCLVVHLSRLDVRRHWVGEVAELSDVRRSVNVDALDVVVERRVGRSKVGGQAAVHRRVDKLSALREQELADVVERKTSLLHSIRHRHRLEVTAVVDLAGLAINERVVGGCFSGKTPQLIVTETG